MKMNKLAVWPSYSPRALAPKRMSGPATESVGGLNGDSYVKWFGAKYRSARLSTLGGGGSAGRADEEFYFQAEEELRKLLEVENPKEGGEK
jgi:hypothetical protein